MHYGGRLKLKFQEFHPSSHLSQRWSTMCSNLPQLSPGSHDLSQVENKITDSKAHSALMSVELIAFGHV